MHNSVWTAPRRQDRHAHAANAAGLLGAAAQAGLGGACRDGVRDPVHVPARAQRWFCSGDGREEARHSEAKDLDRPRVRPVRRAQAQEPKDSTARGSEEGEREEAAVLW